MLRHNENTISTLAKLKENLMATRSAGYAVDDEEEEIGVRCVGAPVLGVSGKVEAAISVSGTVEQITWEDIPRFGAMLQESTFEMSRRLGWTPGPGLAEVSTAVHGDR